MSKPQFFRNMAVAVLALATLPSAALAADLAVAPVAPVAEANPVDLAFSALVTSDYISRGISQTNHGPAVQGTLEVDYDKFYANFFISNVDPAILSGAHVETDWGFGVRPELGPVSLDLGYYWAIYDNSDANGSEAYAKASINPVDPLTLGAAVYINPTSSSVYSEANAAYKLPANFKLSGAVGLVSNTDIPYTSWNAGVSWNPIDPVTLDLRYYGSNLSGADCATLANVASACNSRVVGTLTFASTASTLGLFK